MIITKWRSNTWVQLFIVRLLVLVLVCPSHVYDELESRSTYMYILYTHTHVYIYIVYEYMFVLSTYILDIYVLSAYIHVHKILSRAQRNIDMHVYIICMYTFT